jgi:hypothetical protein
LAPHFGRTATAIKKRAAKLGLSKSQAFRVAAHRPVHKTKNYDGTAVDIVYWIAGYLLSARPRVPSAHQIIERWNTSRATAYRWWRWGQDKLDEIRARKEDT